MALVLEVSSRREAGRMLWHWFSKLVPKERQGMIGR